MYPALALIVLGLAVFTVVVARRPRTLSPNGHWAGVDREQIRGFAHVGAAALGLLALAVVAVGLLQPAGAGEMLAVLGLFAYVAYVAAACAAGWSQSRFRPRRALAAPVQEHGAHGSARTASGVSP